MAIVNRYGKTLVSIVIGDEEMRPRDAVFVFYNPEGAIAGQLVSNIDLRDSIASAARSFWKSEELAFEKLNDGWRIALMPLASLLSGITVPKKEGEA